ncbi:MAG: hypothetical protein EBQ94_01520, partial [Flavobacteriales bacterium]|nr:hypothetical protein [Flavobacteriales bacterium]
LNVSLNTLSRTSACESSYYIDVPSSSTTTTLYLNQTYTVNVSTQSDLAAIVSVWIDWNRNGSFESTEWYQPYINAFTGSVSITVPGTATTGVTKMRVRSRNNGSTNGSGNQSTSFGSGECEDYTITILSTPSAFSWSNGTTTVGSTNPLSVSPTATTTYTCTATLNGCPVTSSGVQVAITPGPTAPTDLAASASSSAQTTTSISASFTAATTPPTGYLVVRTTSNTQPTQAMEQPTR